MKTKTEKNKTSLTAAPPALSAPPGFMPCAQCLYIWRGQCRLHPPLQTGGWAMYPNVANDPNHGCFQGKARA